ncbi:Spherulation-specific family 4, partial [Aspergillus egyptiacus]
IHHNPTVDFLVIVNPNSGPGDGPLPDANYARELPRLNNYRNVTTVGYIRIDYCRKPLSEAGDEIARYAGWSRPAEPNSKLGVSGIFVDETPNLVGDSSERREEAYLRALNRVIKSQEGILGGRLVLHNPGTATEAALTATADVTVVCEEPYERYRSPEVQNWLAVHPLHRTRAGCMISGVPVQEEGEGDANGELLLLHRLVQELRHRSAYIFVTEVKERFYESFGGRSWAALMRALQAE